MKFQFDLPPKECSPNWRGHWAKRAAAARSYRWNVRLTCLSQCKRRQALRSARVLLTFVVPDNRRRDEDNLLASFKPGIDGMVDAGIFEDDCRLSYTTEKVVEPKCRPRVQVTIREL